VTVTDANMCSVSMQEIVTEPLPLNLLITPIDARCNGAIDGSIALNVAGGTPGFRYLWSNNVTTQNLTNVGAGSYSVTVTDANNCTSTTTTQVNEPTEVSLSLDVTDISCFGADDGSIQLTASGGTPGYTYSWTNGSSMQNLSMLGKGVYAVTVFDANNCTGTDFGRITEPAAINLNLSSSPDNGTGNGKASAMVSGGNSPYSYSWNTGQSGSSISNLFSGNYILTVTDANNCSMVDTIFVGSNVGIDDLLTAGIQNLRVFPNPSAGEFQVEVNFDRIQDARLQILDMTGRVVWTHQARNVLNIQEQVSLSYLAKGSYYLRITTSTGSGSMGLILR
jgi:hypothetical protein